MTTALMPIPKTANDPLRDSYCTSRQDASSVRWTWRRLQDGRSRSWRLLSNLPWVDGPRFGHLPCPPPGGNAGSPHRSSRSCPREREIRCRSCHTPLWGHVDPRQKSGPFAADLQGSTLEPPRSGPEAGYFGRGGRALLPRIYMVPNWNHPDPGPEVGCFCRGSTWFQTETTWIQAPRSGAFAPDLHGSKLKPPRSRRRAGVSRERIGPVRDRRRSTRRRIEHRVERAWKLLVRASPPLSPPPGLRAAESSRARSSYP